LAICIASETPLGESSQRRRVLALEIGSIAVDVHVCLEEQRILISTDGDFGAYRPQSINTNRGVRRSGIHGKRRRRCFIRLDHFVRSTEYECRVRFDRAIGMEIPKALSHSTSRQRRSDKYESSLHFECDVVLEHGGGRLGYPLYSIPPGGWGTSDERSRRLLFTR
jgi:hypothetical protein